MAYLGWVFCRERADVLPIGARPLPRCVLGVQMFDFYGPFLSLVKGTLIPKTVWLDVMV